MKSGDNPNRTGLVLLGFASGSADVIAFLLLGHVFASAMTGNTALLGIALSDGNLVAASQPLTALFGFAAGVALAAFIGNRDVRTLVGFEITCLALFAMLWQLGPHSAGEPAQYVLILLCSVAMGVQGIVARRIEAPGVNTIVFTTTLVTIVSSLVEIVTRRAVDPALGSKTRLQVAAFAAYGAGAILAGLLHWTDFALLAWLPMAAVVAMLVTHRNRNAANG